MGISFVVLIAVALVGILVLAVVVAVLVFGIARSGRPAEPACTMDDVRNLAAAGQKIQAIKLYRQLTGAGLKDAKDAVEAMDSK